MNKKDKLAPPFAQTIYRNSFNAFSEYCLACYGHMKFDSIEFLLRYFVLLKIMIYVKEYRGGKFGYIIMCGPDITKEIDGGVLSNKTKEEAYSKGIVRAFEIRERQLTS